MPKYAGAWECQYGTPCRLNDLEDVYTDGKKILVVASDGTERPTGSFPQANAQAPSFRSFYFGSRPDASIDFDTLFMRSARLVRGSKHELHPVLCGDRQFDAKQIWNALWAVRHHCGDVMWQVTNTSDGHLLHIVGDGWQLAVMGIRPDGSTVTDRILP